MAGRSHRLGFHLRWRRLHFNHQVTFRVEATVPRDSEITLAPSQFSLDELNLDQYFRDRPQIRCRSGLPCHPFIAQFYPSYTCVQVWENPKTQSFPGTVTPSMSLHTPLPMRSIALGLFAGVLGQIISQDSKILLELSTTLPLSIFVVSCAR